MSLTSQFQLLPEHVLERICKYSMPIIEDNTGPSPGIAMVRTDLFDSFGPHWRKVALEHYFKHFTLAFNSGTGEVNSTHPVEDGFISIEQECHSLTAVKIHVALSTLLSGKAAYMLAKSKYSSLVFPSVKTMKIDINNFYWTAWKCHASSAASAPSLYQQLTTIFPGVQRVKLLKGAFQAPVDRAPKCEFEKFVLDLFTKFSGVSATFDLKSGLEDMWKVEDIYSTVTELAMFEKCYSEKTFELVHKCSPTLKKLEMHSYTGQDVLDVFTDASGKPVKYPRLTTLELSNGYGPGNKSYVTCPQLLLPSLTHLTIEGGHPFDNDSLFRSVSKTLKSAKVIVDKEQLDVLTKNRVFLGPDYPNLLHVKITNCTWDMRAGNELDDFWPYVYNIAQNVKKLTLPCVHGRNNTWKMLMEGPAMDNITYLKLERECGDLSRMCSLVEKLPQLVHFSLRQLELDYEHRDRSQAEIYNIFTAKWPVLSHQLKYCDVVSEFKKDGLATVGMLLAVMCPSMTRFMSNSRSRMVIQEMINEAIKEEPFSRHADKLKLLTYNGVPEGSKTFPVKQVYW